MLSVKFFKKKKTKFVVKVNQTLFDQQTGRKQYDKSCNFILRSSSKEHFEKYCDIYRNSSKIYWLKSVITKNKFAQVSASCHILFFPAKQVWNIFSSIHISQHFDSKSNYYLLDLVLHFDWNFLFFNHWNFLFFFFFQAWITPFFAYWQTPVPIQA